ncbi:MAG TPA: MerR family transcriptional regulator [Candidatus Tidjanibacter faecipullorum]|uniref:MerR family transcriptional regulator n=1 Tax=Candidatus Tidjanibacter faecipullorum TaxID=2838766 RepID=A0A9D2DDU0_9BACT|nr:MerR family transcriptional regulator [Candidatus Tidjanibacter faecipullorum]
MQEIEHKKNKVYYTMGEVAEMFDVNPSLLRYWEQEFDILKPHRNKKGNRLFTPRDVDNIRVIYHLLKERKMKIEVARKYIRDYRKEVDRDTEIAEHLMHIRAILLEIKQDLTTGGIVVDDDELAEEEPAAEPAPVKPPFEEQMLFEVAVPVELLEAGTAERSDEGFASARAAFEGQETPAESAGEEEPAKERPRIIEQTLF